MGKKIVLFANELPERKSENSFVSNEQSLIWVFWLNFQVNLNFQVLQVGSFWKKKNKKIINEKFYAEFIKGFGSLCERVWSDSGSAVYSPLLRFEIFIISIEKNQILIKLLAWKNQCDLHCRFSSNKYLLMIFKFAWCLCHCSLQDKTDTNEWQTFTTKKKTQF